MGKLLQNRRGKDFYKHLKVDVLNKYEMLIPQIPYIS